MAARNPDSLGNIVPGPVACLSCDFAEICRILDNANNRLPTGHFRAVRTGEALYRAGAKAESFFAIRKGMLKSSMLTRKNQLRLLDIHVPGEALGIEGLHLGTYARDVTALTPAICCELPREAFSNENLLRVPELSLALERLRSSLNKPRRRLARSGTLPNRAKMFFCDLARRLTERGLDPRRLVLEITRKEIGSLFGRGIDSVRGALKIVDEQGVIAIDKNKVRLGAKVVG